ncbi:MAG: AAA family ATPase [Prevotella sp.]|nr:AAA family ATPase [Prevotella sp.]
MTKRAYSPKEIAAKKWVTLPWGEQWSKPFGCPADNASWFISGASAQGKSSFVMQLGKELCKYGPVLYVSYEESVNQSFQRRMDYLQMNEVQGKFRVLIDEHLEDLAERLAKPKSPKFVIVDSFQVASESYGWDYMKAVELMKRFNKKCFIFISQEDKSQPTGKPARRLRYICDMKVRVIGYKAYCQGRAIGDAGSYYVVWEEGVLRTSNSMSG